MIQISGVSERDIDLLLLEEFIASNKFQTFFLEQTKFKDIDLVFLDAQRSVTDSTGESDLEVTFKDNKNQSYVLLIENKVNANFQKDQLARYRQRGTNYIKLKKVIDFTTILVAPESFHNNNLEGFDYRINYEEILKYFQNNSALGDRRKYKEQLLHSAIEKSDTGYQMEADASVTNFWKAYWKISLDVAKEFHMEEPSSKPSTSRFIYFTNISLPNSVCLVHKLVHGNFDLQFNGMGNKIDVMRELYSEKLDNNMQIVKAAKSAAIRVRVPKLSLADSLDSQKEQVLECLEKGKTLLKWYKLNG
jgi:hypothetical protein